MQGIGKVVAQQRKAKGLSQIDLSGLLECTQQFISGVELDKFTLSKEYQVKLSKILDFDFVALYNNFEYYKSFEHYLLCYELIHAIEDKDNEKIKSILKNQQLIGEFNYGRPLILKLYSSALIDLVVHQNYKNSLKKSLEVFKMESISEIQDLKLEASQDYRYYSTILVLAGNLNHLDHSELSLMLLEKTINFLEEAYFNVLPISSIDYYFKRFYIAVLNNYSDGLFMLKESEMALKNCDKAIEFALNNNILYLLDILIQLKVELLYSLGALDEAKMIRNHLFSLCQLMNKTDMIEETKSLFKEKYPLLLES